MNPPQRRNVVTLTLLACGVAVPVIYYGIQVLAAAYEPDYSFVRQAASELGSDRAARAAWFNAGIMMLGGVALAASVGLLRAMLRLRANVALARSRRPPSPSAASRRYGPATSPCPTRATAATPPSSPP